MRPPVCPLDISSTGASGLGSLLSVRSSGRWPPFSCGLATRYWQLFICRFGVGVGEATLSPSAYSIVADSFPLKKIALVLGVYGMGVTLGANVANLLGAWAVGLMEPGVLYEVPVLGERYRWQIVFFLICLPTIPLTALMLFVKEPFRRNVRRVRGDDGKWQMAKPPRGELVLYLRKNWKTVLCHNVGYAWLAFSGYGLGAWLPAFYMRVHGLTATQAGYLLGGIGIVFGTAGTVFGGVGGGSSLCSRVPRRQDADRRLG